MTCMKVKNFLPKTESMPLIQKAAGERDADTDGECYLELYKDGELVEEWGY